jgi:hypothetical protein
MDKKMIIALLAILVVGVAVFGLARKGDDSTGAGVEGAVRAYAAAQLEVEEEAVSVVSTEEREWPNACLGLAGEDEMCAEVITPGFEVVVEVDGEQHTFRTNEDASSIRQE